MKKKNLVMRNHPRPSYRQHILGSIIAILIAQVASAQNVSSAGQNWSTGWGFSSASDRSLSLQQAQAIRQAKAQAQAGPSTVITNYTTTNNDSRSSYQEIVGGTMTFDTIDFQLSGDRIGQNTNSVGSMNTGTTNIDIVGNSNSIIATNSADTDGCVDGSIQQESALFESMASPSGIDISLSPLGRSMRCAP